MTAATAALNGMPDAGNPRIWFCEGKIASAKPRCGPLLCNAARAIATGALCLAAEVASADGTWRWTGAGENALASNPENWQDGAGAATVPTIGADVVFDADGAEKPCTWDLDVALGSWTQDGYTNVVTIETFLPGKGTFEALRITGDATLKTGMWKSTSNWKATKKNIYRLSASIGGDLMLGPNFVMDANGCGYGSGNPLGLGYPSLSGGSYGGPGGCYYGSPWEYAPYGYGSITEPVDLGSCGGQQGGCGGGAIYLVVGGETELQGVIRSNGIGSGYAGSGGSVYLRTGTIRGAGSVQANGKDDVQTSSGGRVAIVLTAPDADFSQFDVVGQASAVCPSLKTVSLQPRAGCGTIYAETPTDRKDHGWLIVKAYGMQPSDKRGAASACYGDMTTCDFDRITLTNNACLRFTAGHTLVLTNTVIEFADVAGKSNELWFDGGKVELGGDASKWTIPCNVQMIDAAVAPLDGAIGLAVPAGRILTVSGGTPAFEGSIEVAGKLSLKKAAYVTLLGDFLNEGVFTSEGNSVVAVAGSGVSAITGANKFENFICQEPGKGVAFEAGKTQTFTQSLTLKGDEELNVSLGSIGDAGAWGLKAGDGCVVFCQYLDVSNSDASSGQAVTTYASADSGGNSNWTFEAEPKNAWLGTVSSDFADPANWSMGKVPGEGSDFSVDSENLMVISTPVSFASALVCGHANVVIDAAVSVVGDLVVSNSATLSCDHPVSAGNVYVHSGAALTHSANGKAQEHWIDLQVVGNLEVVSGGRLHADSKGHTGAGGGPGVSGNGASHGGRGWSGPTCYGSIFCPTNLGSVGGSGNGNSPGGGAIRLRVGGEAKIDGTLSANATGTGSGGSVWLTANRLAGSGTISAVSGNSWGACGRIAIYLTGEGEEFTSFKGKTSVSQGQSDYTGAAGTLYIETAADEPHRGLIRVSGCGGNNGTEIPSPRLNADVFEKNRCPRLEIKDKGMANVTGDFFVSDLLMPDSTGNIRLNGHVCGVRHRQHAIGTSGSQVVPGGTDDAPGRIEWMVLGFRIILR